MYVVYMRGARLAYRCFLSGTCYSQRSHWTQSYILQRARVYICVHGKHKHRWLTCKLSVERRRRQCNVPKLKMSDSHGSQLARRVWLNIIALSVMRSYGINQIYWSWPDMVLNWMLSLYIRLETVEKIDCETLFQPVLLLLVNSCTWAWFPPAGVMTIACPTTCCHGLHAVIMTSPLSTFVVVFPPLRLTRVVPLVCQECNYIC